MQVTMHTLCTDNVWHGVTLYMCTPHSSTQGTQNSRSTRHCRLTKTADMVSNEKNTAW